MSTVIVDTGLGNVRSVERAVQRAATDARLGGAIERTGDPERIRKADRVVVPGQGGFRDAARGFGGAVGEAIRERIEAGTPYLGICLGLQILLDSSEEAPGVAGLGLIPGKVVGLVPTTTAKVPHMGWNQLEIPEGAEGRLAGAARGEWFYFVHSYHAVPDDPSLVVATVTHGSERVTAAIAKGNVLATQFHPEKSRDAGLALLERFLST